MSDTNSKSQSHTDTNSTAKKSKTVPQGILEDYLDEHDYQIFQKLNEDGRMPDTELAEEVGLSRTAVRRRRQNLIDSGSIDILAVIVLQELDLAYADVLVNLSKDAPVAERSALISKLIDQDLIYSLDSCLGQYDLFVRLWHESLSEVKSYTWELFAEESIVESYEVVPMVHTWKAWDKELDRPKD